MAIIGSIRRQGKLVAIVIGLALFVFVITSFDRTNIFSCNKSQNTTIIGEVGGEKITYTAFEQKVTEQMELIKQKTGKETPTASEIYQMKEEIWKTMVRDIILEKEYDELGLGISDDEFADLLFGKEPHQYILQFFTDPQTGQFNPLRVKDYRDRIDEYDAKYPGVKIQWSYLLENVISDRLNNKYLNLIKEGYYVPKTLAKMDYEQKNRKVVFRYFVDKYADMPDKSIKLSQEDYQKYYDNHKQEYIVEDPTRSFDYIVYDVQPSTIDLKKVTEEVALIRTEIETQKDEDIPAFVSRSSDENYDSTFYKKGGLPTILDTVIFKEKKKDEIEYNVKKGEIIGPLFFDNTHTIAKIIDLQSRPDSMKASDILISYKESKLPVDKITRTKENAKKIADSLLLIIKKDANSFEKFAFSISDDSTSGKKAGDLGWFADGTFPSELNPINEACLAGKVGDYKIVETAYGFHITKITGKLKLEKKVRLAIITRNVLPSKETNDSVYQMAGAFAAENSTLDQFNKSVIAKKLNKRSADDIAAMVNTVPGLDNPREVIKWVYKDDVKVGQVSSVFDLQGKFVVAVLKGIKEKGIPTLDQIKTEIEPYVMREKKAEAIIKKINALKTAGITIDQLAAKNNASVDTLDYITFSYPNIKGCGPEPEIIGTLFSLKKGQLSEPLKGKAGVLVVYIDNFVEPPAVNDYSMLKQQMLMTFISRVGYELYSKLEKNTSIKDNRVLFY